MPTAPRATAPRTLVVVGGGLVGACTAWALQRRGHQVHLLDPGTDEGGSWAALGVLMGQVFHRSSGRGWRLRQRSLELWRDWGEQLEQGGQSIPRRRGLLLLASDSDEDDRLQRLAAERQRRGLPLEIWQPERLQQLTPELPAPARIGLHSPADGQLDPIAALNAFRNDALRAGVVWIRDRAVAIEAGRGGGWRLEREHGDPLVAEGVVLCLGTTSQLLLEPLGITLPLEPVLGQALELELEHAWGDGAADPGPGHWPGAVSWRGCNLIPRPDRPGGRRLWLGATLEPGLQADPQRLEELALLHGDAPDWLRSARRVRQWQGVRPRPVGRPAPLLEAPAPGLVLAGGHYRNGVLLAPATAEWVCRQFEPAG